VSRFEPACPARFPHVHERHALRNFIPESIDIEADLDTLSNFNFTELRWSKAQMKTGANGRPSQTRVG
jgi:hypothetical protein